MYIGVDLKVIEGLAASVGRAGGLSEDAALAGLVRLWHRCWADKITVLSTSEVAGVFAFNMSDPHAQTRAIGALEAFGFLEAKGVMWRVRGAARYLRLHEARKRGGRASAGNLNKGKSPGLRAGPQPEVVSQLAPGSAPALSPSTEHPSPNLEAKPSPRSRVVSDRLVATFLEVRGAKYKFGKSVDGPALARLLKACDSDDEIDRRWRVGLNGVFQQAVSSIAQLDSKWNALTTGSPGASKSGLYVAPLDGERPSGLVDLSQFMPKDP